MLEGTGHMPMLEKNAEWSAAITAFLTEDYHGTPDTEHSHDSGAEDMHQKEAI
jgi:hypothetical protein